MSTLKLLSILFLIPFISFSQKENQLLTSTKGIFIEQNNQGKAGLVNDKGDVLVPIVNEYIRETVEGQGFIVFEKIVIQGPDYTTGVVRFYDKNGKDVFKRTFTRIASAGPQLLICYEDNLCGLFNRNGTTVAPICFSEIRSLEGKFFWFNLHNNLRGEIESILSSKTISEDKVPANVSAAEQDGYNIFEGVFTPEGKLICQGKLRLVDILIYDGVNPLFAVQNQQQFIDNDGAANFAIMNGKGELVSDYIYSEVIKIDDQLIGEIQTDEEIKKVPLDNQGKPKK